MTAFLSDLTPFHGTGEKNAFGQTLEEFLEEYDPRKYETPSVTTDAVIFSYESEEDLKQNPPRLKLLLVKRSNHPSIGYWALPGGFANMREDLDETAKRELEEETGVSGLFMEQLSTYGNVNRDPRTRIITTAYMALVKEQDVKVQAGDDAADAAWCQLFVEKEVVDETTERFRISVVQKEKELDTLAVVKHSFSSGLIRKNQFEVEERGKIAVDHAAIIAEAYNLLWNRGK